MNSGTPVNRCSPVPFVCSLNPSVSDVLGKDTLSLFELVRIKLHCQSRCVAADFCVCMLVISCLLSLNRNVSLMFVSASDVTSIYASEHLLRHECSVAFAVSAFFCLYKGGSDPRPAPRGIFVLYPLTKSRSGAVNTATSTRRLADVSVCQLLWRKNGLFTVNSN